MHASLAKSAVDAMSFGEHLDELRKRLVHALVGLVPIFAISLVVGLKVTAWMLLPVERALMRAGMSPMLQQTGPLESFGSYMKVSAILTVLVGSPWVLWQAWMFVAPGLYAREKRFAYLLAPLSSILMMLGVAFLYWIMLPLMLFFFVNFGADLGQIDAKKAALPAGISLPHIPALEADPIDPKPGDCWVNIELYQLRVCVGPVGGGGEAVGGAGSESAAPETRGEGADGGAAEANASGAGAAEQQGRPDPGVAAPAAANGKKRPGILCVPLARPSGLAQQYRVSEYLNLVLTLALSFALAFQMPVVVLLLGWAGIIQTSTLSKYRKYAFFSCAVLGAVITPTSDPMSMMMLTLPLYLLYELGLILLRVLPASRVARGFLSGEAKKQGAAGARAGAGAGSAGGTGGTGGRPVNEYGEYRDGER